MINHRLLSLLAPVLLVAGLAVAEEHHHDAKSPATSAPTTKAVNTMCPVETDHPVDDRMTIIYKGQVIGFCCEDCPAEFKKNPEKYLNNLP
ncbi:hypothetical protein BH10PLA1_BH10PLA1_10790 [soil metagenome]